ncbi:surfeit locus 1 family protein [Cohaesibacter sp. ES.047]|uniref:SURF1 family protein n=1 Tax=Cohaesibacter sp. ES.047 TaxID=1798205 RepID=UPI000BB8125B|nr:SURF1 family protein [Cohaesibacter sp. ES.047]SNY92041.1 surfeit locus 1 family protein [Cohaesibacter sp. ES.047]
MTGSTRTLKIATFTLFALVLLCALIALGTWQLRRLEWKEQLIADVNARIEAAPVPAMGPDQWADLSQEESEYLPVTATGTYNHDREVHVWFPLNNPRGGDYGGSGYFILTPLTTAEGWTVIVNRGFVPETMKQTETRPQTLVAGEQTVTGLVRFDEPEHWNSPRPDREKNVWIGRQVDKMAGFMLLDQDRTAPYWIDLLSGQGVNGLPQGGETRITFRNAHLSYALTWFGLAFALIAVYGAWIYRSLRGPSARS